MKLSKQQLDQQYKPALEAGFFDWNVLTLDQMVEYLEEKHKFSSTGESKCIYHLIEFYKNHKKIDENTKM